MGKYTISLMRIAMDLHGDTHGSKAHAAVRFGPVFLGSWDQDAQGGRPG